MNNDNGIDSTDRVRRRHPVARQPSTATATVLTKTPTHIHSVNGAGSEASPSVFVNSRAPSAPRTAISTLTGTQTRRQRLVRQPTTATKATTVTISTVSGNHPPSSEIPLVNA